MSQSLPLFDAVFAPNESRKSISVSQRRRDEGIKLVLDNASDIYKSKFESAVREMKGTFTSEDVLEKVGLPASHCNVVGALMRSLALQNVIKKTGQYKPSERPSRRAGMVALWVRV